MILQNVVYLLEIDVVLYNPGMVNNDEYSDLLVMVSRV